MTASILLLAALVVPAGAQITAGDQTVRVQFYAPDVARVLKWTSGGGPEKQSLVVVARPDSGPAITRSETDEALTLSSSGVRVRISKSGGVVSFSTSEGASVLVEAGPAAFTPVTTPFEKAFSVAQAFRLTPDEGIYGLGQHQDAFMNDRGRTVTLVQTNTDAGTPVVVSTGGWGLLWDNDSKTVFADDAKGASLWSEVADTVDYYFFSGPSLDAVIGGYRRLTGEAPLLRWDDARRELTLEERDGQFPGMLKSRTFQVVLVRPGHGTGGEATTAPDRVVTYDGTRQVVSF
jgi:alpha-D-xyloside xylohydrolase